MSRKHYEMIAHAINTQYRKAVAAQNVEACGYLLDLSAELRTEFATDPNFDMGTFALAAVDRSEVKA